MVDITFLPSLAKFDELVPDIAMIKPPGDYFVRLVPKSSCSISVETRASGNWRYISPIWSAKIDSPDGGVWGRQYQKPFSTSKITNLTYDAV
jgi:hypothetical protein